jgi:Zn finger protein HypA/HybF involved in hydrogenase expression
MPIPAKPFTLQCPACNWSRTIAPTSDVLTLQDFPACCPKCGSISIERRNATALTVMAANFRRRLGI